MLDLSAMQDVYVTVHVGAGEPGTRGSWARWRAIVKWAEPAPAPAPERDAAVLLVPDTGPLALMVSWASNLTGQMGDGLWTCATDDGLSLWLLACDSSPA